MKKRLVTILSLVMAFVLCFALVACGGDNDDGSKDKKPAQSGKAVSVSLSDAIDAVNGVLDADGFTGTASYTLSTKNTEALTDSVSLDKRGDKIKFTAGNDEIIIDLNTGYVYSKYSNGYNFANEFYANMYDYVQYVLASLKEQAATQKFNARYDSKTNTVTFTAEKADSVNKYLAPIQSAYKNSKTVGDLLDDYSKLLFGKNFDAMYNAFEEYVKDSKNTVGTLIEALNDLGIDVEAILEMAGLELEEEIMTAIKARPLNKVITGAYNFIMENLGSLMTLDETDDDDYGSEVGGGMESLGMGLVNAMLFDEVADEDVTAALAGFKTMIGGVKQAGVKTMIDSTLKDIAEVADLYTVIKNGVKLKNMTTTFTLNVDADKNIMGVKLDYLLSHTYTGEAAEGSFLADNDYRATAEIKIDEYKAPTADFVINFNPAMDYKTSVIALVYEVTDKDVSVYYEAGSKTVNMTSYSLYTQPLNGEVTPLTDVAENAFKFDAATSSFVFDGALVKSALTGAEFGDSLYAVVFFDDDDYSGYVIALSYVNNDMNDIYDYLYNDIMDNIYGFIGGAGSDAPNNGDYGQAD